MAAGGSARTTAIRWYQPRAEYRLRRGWEQPESCLRRPPPVHGPDPGSAQAAKGRVADSPRPRVEEVVVRERIFIMAAVSIPRLPPAVRRGRQRRRSRPAACARRPGRRPAASRPTSPQGPPGDPQRRRAAGMRAHDVAAAVLGNGAGGVGGLPSFPRGRRRPRSRIHAQQREGATGLTDDGCECRRGAGRLPWGPRTVL